MSWLASDPPGLKDTSSGTSFLAIDGSGFDVTTSSASKILVVDGSGYSSKSVTSVTSTLLTSSDAFHAESGGSDPATYNDFTSGSSDNQMYIGHNSSGWWNLTTGYRFQVDIPKNAVVIEAKLHIYCYGVGSGISGTPTCEIHRIESDSVTLPTSASSATTYLGSSRKKLGEFTFSTSTSSSTWYTYTLDNSELTTHFARSGWAADNYLGIVLQQLPVSSSNRPSGSGSGEWLTFESGRYSSTYYPYIAFKYI